ncbi:unnamed protein product [Allacma fusca]|uniref:Uncharacterized protein n=1 Tax=Allacma fusca TaxID=39272 RepID=A0A8J2KNN8_9HEXA|nr:unnamed protein product [Allacma fusca]
MKLESYFIILFILGAGGAKSGSEDPLLVKSVLGTYKCCLIRLVSFTPAPLFDYSGLARPMQTLNYPLKQRLNTKTLNILSHRNLSNSSVSIRCFVFVLLSAWQGFDKDYDLLNPIINNSGYGWQNLQFLVQLSSVIKPQLYFLYFDDPKFLRDFKTRYYGSNLETMYQAVRLISPIFLIRYLENNLGTQTTYYIPAGWLFCPFCNQPFDGVGFTVTGHIGTITQVNCEFSSNCIAKLLTTYDRTASNRQNVKWYFDAQDAFHIADKIKIFVFQEGINNDTFPTRSSPQFSICVGNIPKFLSHPFLIFVQVQMFRILV